MILMVGRMSGLFPNTHPAIVLFKSVKLAKQTALILATKYAIAWILCHSYQLKHLKRIHSVMD